MRSPRLFSHVGRIWGWGKAVGARQRMWRAGSAGEASLLPWAPNVSLCFCVPSLCPGAWGPAGFQGHVGPWHPVLSTPPARGTWAGTGNGGHLETLQHQQLPRSSAHPLQPSWGVFRHVGGAGPHTATRWEQPCSRRCWGCLSAAKPELFPAPALPPAFSAAPVSHALGLGATCGSITGRRIRIQLCSSHLGQDENGSFGCVPPVSLVLKVQMQSRIKTVQLHLAAPCPITAEITVLRC